MTVGDLLKTLKHVSPHANVWVTFAGVDERKATCVTQSRHGGGLHICDSNAEVSASETIIFDEES